MLTCLWSQRNAQDGSCLKRGQWYSQWGQKNKSSEVDVDPCLEVFMW